MKCDRCDGSGKIIGLFPIYSDEVPPEKRKPYVELGCDMCDGLGAVDDEYPARKERGERCRQIRIDREVTGREFAKRFGLNVLYVSQFERGKQIPDATEILAAYETLKSDAIAKIGRT